MIRKVIKVLSVLSVMMLLLASIHMIGFAVFQAPPKLVAKGQCGQDVYWVMYNDRSLIIKGTGDMFPVFAYGTNPNAIGGELPLTVVIEEGVTSIGERAFYLSTVESITIPSSVKYIAKGAFEDCSLKSVTIPSAVTRIEERTFYGCNRLESVIIPAGVTDIAASAFDMCTSLTRITVDGANKDYSDLDGVLYNKDKTTLVRYPSGIVATSFEIPASVKNIVADAFEGCTVLTDYTVNSANKVFCAVDGVIYNKEKTQLVRYPLGKNSTSVSVANGVTDIGEAAFCDNRFLTAVTFPNSLRTIGISAFENCENMNSVAIPDTVTHIGDKAFKMCLNIGSITIPESVSRVGQEAFMGCRSLSVITISGESVSIGKDAFKNTNFYRDTRNWKQDVLYCGYHLVAVRDTISGHRGTQHRTKSIADSAFADCKDLTGITLTDTVRIIGKYAFLNCTSLTNINLKKNVMQIGENAFDGCTSLAVITICNSECDIFDSAATIPANTVIRGSEGSSASEYARRYGRTFVAFEYHGDELFDGINALVMGDSLLVVAGTQASSLLMQAGAGSYLKDAGGNNKSGEKMVITGDFLLLRDRTKLRIAVLGDINYDGEITTADARLVLRKTVDLEVFTAEQDIAANIAGGETADVACARKVLRAAVGLERPQDWFKEIR